MSIVNSRKPTLFKQVHASTGRNSFQEWDNIFHPVSRCQFKGWRRVTRGREEETFRPRETRLPSSALNRREARFVHGLRVNGLSDSVNMNISPQDFVQSRKKKGGFLGATFLSINYATRVCTCINKANYPQKVIFRLKESNRCQKCDNLFFKNFKYKFKAVKRYK